MSSTRRHHERASRLFAAAKELPAEERDAFVRRQCADKPALLNEVLSLLASDDDVPGILRTGGMDERVRRLERETAPEFVGPFRLESVIGEGGMGVVYRAWQERPVRRAAAVKLLRRALDSERLRSRFQLECQALATMSHPNVASIYEAGTTDDGQMYLAMELVEGQPITEYCDTHQLSIRQRIKLLIDVAGGVQHAHQRAVIHRDLKPSNVLVCLDDGKPVVKLIDFGIAKALDRGLTEKTLHTVAGELLCTPEYMSPEHADLLANRVDTRTDVYGLGVLLYELITGGPPLDATTIKRSSFDELCAMVRTLIPPAPSQRLKLGSTDLGNVAKARGTTPKQLRRDVSQDLDSIALKCLAPDADERYATPLELIEELQRFLSHEPVRARNAGALFRTLRYVRRRKLAVGTASAVLVTLVAFTLVTADQNQRLKVQQRALAQQSRLAESTRDFAFQLVNLADEDLDIEKKVEVIESALDAIEEVVGEDLQLRMKFLRDLRDHGSRCASDDTCAVLYKATDISLARAPQDAPEVIRFRAEKLINSTHSPDTQLKERQMREALGPTRAAFGAADLITLRLERALATVLRRSGRGDEAEAILLRVLQGLGVTDAATERLAIAVKSELASVYMRLNRLAEAERLLVETLQTEQQRIAAGRANPNRPFPQGLLVRTNFNLAVIHAHQGQHERAIREFRYAIDHGLLLVMLDDEGNEFVGRRAILELIPTLSVLDPYPEYQAIMGEDGYLMHLEAADAASWENDYDVAMEHVRAAVERGLDGSLLANHRLVGELKRQPQFKAYVAQFAEPPTVLEAASAVHP